MKLSEMYDEINGVKWTGFRSLHKQSIKAEVAKLEAENAGLKEKIERLELVIECNNALMTDVY